MSYTKWLSRWSEKQKNESYDNEDNDDDPYDPKYIDNGGGVGERGATTVTET